MKPAKSRPRSQASAPARESDPAQWSSAGEPREFRAPVGLYQSDAAGACVYVNDRWSQLAGMAADEAMGRGWVHAVHPDDRERVAATWSRVVAAASPFAAEYRYRRPDGTVVWVNDQAAPEIDESGSVIGFVGAVTDVSERRFAEESLRTSEARFRALADATAAAFWTVDETGDPRDAATTRWPFLTNVPADDIAAGWLAAVHPDDREPGNAVWRAGLAEGRPFAFEQRVRQRDGSWRHFLVRAVPVRDEDGTIREWVGADIDITERKGAEEALRHSEERYRTLFESVDQGFCIIEMIAGEDGLPSDYRFEEVNPTFARHTGLTDAVGKTARELVPGLEAQWIDIYGRVAATGERRRFEQGSEAMGRWFEVEAARIGGEGSRRVALLFSDVTERKHTEDALRQSEQRLRSLADAMPQVVWAADPDGTVRYYNSRVSGFAAVSQTAPGGWDWQPTLHPDDAPASTEAWRRAVREASPYVQEHRILMSDGQYRWHLSRAEPILDAAGQIETWYGATTDIHDLKQSEIARRENEERLRLGIDVAGFALLEVEYDAGVIHLSAEAARLYGLGDAAVTVPREQVHATFHPDDRDDLTRRIAQSPSQDAAEPYTTEYRVAWPSGETRWLSVRKQVVFGGEGPAPRPVRAMLAALDITARKRAEADRQALLDALAHDLRNPLTALKMQAQLLLRQIERGRTPDRDALAERAAGFVELAVRMTGLIDDLEEHARLATGGGFHPDRQPTDLVALARNSADELRQSGGGRRIRLETDETALVGVWDPLHVRRVLENLLGNAVKYSPLGSEVRVRLSRIGRYAVLEVHDEGIGIPADDLPRIFAFRHRGGNVGSVAGSGVGLAGVKQIVERHGGTVTVESEEGRGSVFTVRLPLLATGR